MAFIGGVGYTNVDLHFTGLPDLPKLGEEIFSQGFAMHLGGGVPATLVHTARLGIASHIVTFLGEDGFSRFAKQAYQSYGAQVVNLYEGSAMPVVLTTVMAMQGDRAFVSYQDKLQPTDAMLEQIYQHLTGAKIVDMQVGFLEVYRKLKQEGTTLVFDTGWEADLSLAKYKEYLNLADYYLPNRKEALQITGTQSIDEAAKVLAQYLDPVIIKLDADGCLIQKGQDCLHVSPLPAVQAVDATGGGDAFMSGFLYGLFYDAPIEQCVRYGNVMGGRCVQAVGCLTCETDEPTLKQLSEQLTVAPWKQQGGV